MCLKLRRKLEHFLVREHGAVHAHVMAPDLAVPALADAAVRAAGHVRPLIEVDFRTGSAGAGIAHAPECVLFAEAEDALVLDASHFLSEFE